MTSLLPILQVLVPLFALVLLGFLLRRYAGVLHLGHMPSFTSLVLNVTLPAAVILAIVGAQNMSVKYLLLPLAMLAAEVGAMTLAFLTGRALRLPRPTMGMLLMCAGFGNTAFLGYAVVQSLHPVLYSAAVIVDQFACVLPMLLTAGLLGGVLGNGRGAEGGTVGPALRRFVQGPIFISVVIALILRFIPWPSSLVESPAAVTLGHMAASTLGYLAKATTPIALLALGAALQPRAAAKASWLLFVPSAFKLIVCPLLMWGICRVFGIHGDLLSVGVLQSSMPTSVICSLLCVQYEMDGALAGGVVFAATALSIVSIPLLQAVMH